MHKLFTAEEGEPQRMSETDFALGLKAPAEKKD
jgi:hypothetical protein